MLISRLLRRFSSEQGQVIMLAVATFPVLLGMTGMALDVGTFYSERRDLQNAADSIALAAAQELPDANAARIAGEEFAAENDVAVADLTLEFDTVSDPPVVHATITRNHEFAFMRVLGVDNRDVGAGAAAVKVSFGGGAGIVPWTITQATQDAATLGAVVVMKYDADGADTGNFGAIRIDGPGANVYNDSVMYGSDSFACAVSAPNCTTGACPGVYPATCSENSPTCDGAECTPQTGNLIGPTRTGVDFRMNNTSTDCNEFAEAFGAPDPVTGISTVNPDCNPWTDGPGRCTSDTDICSRRVIIIPVVDEFGNGASDPATIQRFALLFLEGYDSGKCQGNSCEIKGRFVKADINPRALAGTFDPEASIHFARLSE